MIAPSAVCAVVAVMVSKRYHQAINLIVKHRFYLVSPLDCVDGERQGAAGRLKWLILKAALACRQMAEVITKPETDEENHKAGENKFGHWSDLREQSVGELICSPGAESTVSRSGKTHFYYRPG